MIMDLPRTFIQSLQVNFPDVLNNIKKQETGKQF